MEGGERCFRGLAGVCFTDVGGIFEYRQGAGDGVQKPAVGWLGWCMHPASSSNSSSQTFANISSWCRIQGARLEAFIVCWWKQTICHDTAARNVGMGMIFITQDVAKHLSQSESVYGSAYEMGTLCVFACGPLFVKIAFGSPGWVRDGFIKSKFQSLLTSQMSHQATLTKFATNPLFPLRFFLGTKLLPHVI